MPKPHARLIVGVAALALIGAACTDGEPEASPSPTPETDVFSESLVGTRVTVSGDVGETHSDELLELVGENVPRDGLLVFVPEEAEGDDPPFDEDDRLRVRGTIERFDPDEHGADRDEAAETPEADETPESPEVDEADEFEDRAVIVAEEIEVVAEEEDEGATPEATSAPDATPSPEVTPEATPTPTPTPTPEPTATVVPTPTAVP